MLLNQNTYISTTYNPKHIGSIKNIKAKIVTFEYNRVPLSSLAFDEYELSLLALARHLSISCDEPPRDCRSGSVKLPNNNLGSMHM